MAYNISRIILVIIMLYHSGMPPNLNKESLQNISFLVSGVSAISAGNFVISRLITLSGGRIFT